MAPAARLVLEGHSEARQLQEMIVTEGLDLQHLAQNGLMEAIEAPSVEPSETIEPSFQDEWDMRSLIIEFLSRLDGRPLCREELDEYMRAAGRRKIKRPGMIMQSFRMSAKLAELGVNALDCPTGKVSWKDFERSNGIHPSCF